MAQKRKLFVFFFCAMFLFHGRPPKQSGKSQIFQTRSSFMHVYTHLWCGIAAPVVLCKGRKVYYNNTDTNRITYVKSRFFTLFMPFVTLELSKFQTRKEKIKMIQNGKKYLFAGSILLTGFVLWTALLQMIDVQPLGQKGTNIGFATLNLWFHRQTGVHMALYTMTDRLGLVPIFVCFIFGITGLIQLIRRKSLLKVDYDILILGIYYIIVILCYLVFEMIPINYRPVEINGFMEVSYPSSTTLLVICVMPTLTEQLNRRLKNGHIKKAVTLMTAGFSLFMVIGRLVSGVHWLTDIIGSILLSTGLFSLYKATILLKIKEVKH